MKANCMICGTNCTMAGRMWRSEWCECPDYTTTQASLVLKYRKEIDAIKKSGKRMTPHDIKQEMEFAAQNSRMKGLTHFEKWCIAELETIWNNPPPAP